MKTKKNTDTDSLYLNKLKFDPKLYLSPFYKYMTNVRLLILIMLSLVTAGVLAFSRLPRELNPEVDIPIVVVRTVLPGASSKDVESLVTKKIEKIQTNLTNLDTMNSTSSESFSVVVFQFLSNQETDKAVDEVKEEVDLIINDLPTEAEDPVVEKLDFNDQAVWTFALTGDIDTLSLSDIAKELEDRLERTKGIRKVEVSGQESEEVSVALRPEALSQYGISTQQVTQALQANNINFPAGNIDINNLRYSVALNSELSSVEDIRRLPLSIGQQVLQLSELANVQLRAVETSSFVSYSSPQQGTKTAVELSVFKAAGESPEGSYQKAKAVVESELKKYPQLQYITVLNVATESTEQFEDLQGNFTNSILLIFIAMCLFLGVRQAITGAFSLPLTLLTAFFLMSLMGMTLNFLSLFSLLLAISLIGDDAIVISQATRSYSKKFSPIETGLLVFKDFALPIWAGTLTVVWSFLPLLLAGGIIGEFIKPIPLVVSATLLSSTAIAVFINLPINVQLAQLKLPRRVIVLLFMLLSILGSVVVIQFASGSQFTSLTFLFFILSLVALFLSRSKITQLLNRMGADLAQRSSFLKRTGNYFKTGSLIRTGIIDISPVVNRYKVLLSWVVTKRRRRFGVYGIVISFIVLAIIFVASGLLKQEFFPKVGQDQVYVNIEGPAGWQVRQTQQVMAEVQADLLTLPEVTSIISRTNSSFGDEPTSGPNYGYLRILLKDEKDRQRDSIEISDSLRQKFLSYQTAKVNVVELSGGPPAGADFQADIKGGDLIELEKISDQFMSELSEIEGVVNITTSLKLSSGQISVTLLPTEMQTRGLSAIQVGSWLRTALSDSEAPSLTIDNSELDLKVTLEQEKESLSYLQNLPIYNQSGERYTLSEVAVFHLENSPTSITRSGNDRVVRVTATGRNLPAPELLKQFNEKMKDYELPEGYSWSVGGANQENAESVQSIIQAMGISFLLILVTMVLQLGSFRKAFLVLAIIPLAISGVFINFTIFGIPLSFPALIGVLALFGIVVNNSIMIMEKINLNLEQKFEFYEGVTDASASRLEPIFLSSFTAILGLLPITIADPLWRGLGGAIVAGLSLSGVIVLFLLPALFVELFHPPEK